MTLFDPAGLKERLDELNFIAEKPDFWSDRSAAQKLLSDTVTPERDSALYDAYIRLADQAVKDERKAE